MSWLILISVFLLAVQTCTGEKSCVIWSTGGHVVQRGDTFQIYCAFKRKCKISMKDYPPTHLRHHTLNNTTYYFNVIKLSNDRTYSCECKDLELDSCGIDISTGYPPDPPTNISCIYKIPKSDDGVVTCTWDQGRDTNLKNTSVLWVKTGNNSASAAIHKVDSKGFQSPTASFAVPMSVQILYVWVHTYNDLGRVNSSIVNYTLSKIVMPSPPSVRQTQCFSRSCDIQLEQHARAATLDIQYRVKQEPWTTITHTVVHSSTPMICSVGPLEPYNLYQFRVRRRFSTGLWSQWSTSVSNWTQEEVPAKELDVWFTQPEADIKSLRIYWKEADPSILRGKITQYEVRVSPYLAISRISAEETNYSVPLCDGCDVTVWACNSKGRSPPAKITNRHSKGGPPKDVLLSGLLLSWRRPESALQPTAYVLEWYPKGQKLDKLEWLRLGREHTHSVLSGVKPLECYDGAVYAIYNDSTVSGQRFTNVATAEAVPSAAPQLWENVNRNTVRISWKEIPRFQRGGCLTNYSIYVENEHGLQMLYYVQPTETLFTIPYLSPGEYNLWMSASTAKGEGPSTHKVKLYIEPEFPLSILLGCVSVSTIAVLLLCLCQNSTVRNKFYTFFHCFMFNVVPDPANSKWAKEYNQDKGRMKLQPQLSNCSGNMEEDPMLVDLEELHKQNGVLYAQTVSSQVAPQSELKAELSPLYPPTTYIKSFSQDSASSEHTQASVETTTTLNYITAHGSASIDEEYEVEDDDNSVDMHFLPSQNMFAEPLECGGRLTLDAVRFDCSNLKLS